MDNKIDVQSLGTDYNIINENSELVKAIKIIKQEDILTSAIGEYSEDYYSNFSDYLEGSIEKFHNFAESPFSVYWHTCSEEDFDLIEIVDICVENKYDFVILELLEPEYEDIFLS